MKTTLYLVRHGATESNLAEPPVLQGRGRDQPLAPLGVRQAERTRDFLALYRLDCICTSPLRRAFQTAEIIAGPHELIPQPVANLTECDVGTWEGLSWEEIQKRFPQDYQLYMSDPARHGYLRGETFADVYNRTTSALEEIVAQNKGGTALVVAHHVVSRVYLAGVLGLPISMSRQVTLGNCSISIVRRKGDKTVLKTLNSMFHMDGITA